MKDPVPTTALERPRQWLALAFALTGAWYLGWRLDTLDAASPWLSGLVLAAESLCFGAMLMQVTLGWRLSLRQSPVPLAAYAVDLFVLAGQATPELLRKTLRSAIALQGPHTVWLLADPRGNTAALAEELGCQFVASPGAGDDAAAHLNLALAQSQAGLVAWIDGDQACRRDFLSRTVGYFNDPLTAFVQTPRGLPGDGGAAPAPTSAAAWLKGRWLDGRFSAALPSRSQLRGWDRWNATLLCGSGAVLRRSALLAIGGFASGGAGFCLQTSARLHAQGARSVWHDERLTFSIAPEAAAAEAIAHTTAPRGAWREEGLSTAQRLRYLAVALAPLAPARKAVFLIAPVLAVFGADLPAAAQHAGFLTDLALHLLPVVALGAVLQAEISRGEAGWLQVQTHHLTRLGTPVQRLLLLANASASIAACNSAWAGSSTLPAAWALAAWAGLNAGLLAAALRAGARVRGRDRTRQRFMVALAAELVSQTGERVQGTVDDLSEAGLRFYGSLLPSIAQGQAISGTVHLPDGPLIFRGEVRHLSSSTGGMHQPRSVGCRIEVDAAGSERLEAFLYGCDMQWQIQGDSQSPATPLRRWLPERPPALARRQWNGAQLRAHILAEATPVLSAAPDQAHADDLVISHAALPENLPLVLDVFRRMAVPSRGVRLQRVQDCAAPSLGTDASALYIYRVESAGMPDVPQINPSLGAPFVLVDDEPLLMHRAANAARQIDPQFEIEVEDATLLTPA